jgi:cytochrome c-type biogenesis protein CcsB
MDAYLTYLAVGLYLGGTLSYLGDLVSRRRGFAAVGTALAAAGFVAHTLGLGLGLAWAGRPPFGSVVASLSFLAWAVILVYLIAELWYRSRALGAFVLPIVLVASALAAAMPKRLEGLMPTLQGVWLWVHVVLSLFGAAAFALAFCAGLVYLLQERELKSKLLGALFFRLPALEQLDDLGYKSLSLGFPLLTLGLITGFVWAQYAHAGRWEWDPTLVSAVVTWLIYAGLLHARLAAGWRGRKAAILSIIGFGALVFSIVGVNLFAKGFHTLN